MWRVADIHHVPGDRRFEPLLDLLIARIPKSRA
jgi:hypothetical protein